MTRQDEMREAFERHCTVPDGIRWRENSGQYVADPIGGETPNMFKARKGAAHFLTLRHNDWKAACEWQSQQSQGEPVGVLDEDGEGLYARITHDDVAKYRASVGDPVYLAPPAPAAVPECPFPCGWDKLYTLAVEKSAFLARSLEPGDELTDSYREAAINQGAYLRLTLLTLIKATQTARNE